MSNETPNQDGETTPKEKTETKPHIKGPYDLGNLTIESDSVVPKNKKTMEEEKRGFNHDGGCYEIFVG